MPYCNKCGAVLAEGEKFCSACGQQAGAPLPRGSMNVAEEIYLGGFSSPNLKRGLMRGYGIYATSHRIIGVKHRAGVLAGAMLGGLVGAAVISASKDDSVKQIQDLEKKKDFQIFKDQISQIEVKKPKAFSAGHIHITSKNKEETKISMAGKKEYEKVKELLNAFHPSVLRVQE